MKVMTTTLDIENWDTDFVQLNSAFCLVYTPFPPHKKVGLLETSVQAGIMKYSSLGEEERGEIL